MGHSAPNCKLKMRRYYSGRVSAPTGLTMLTYNETPHPNKDETMPTTTLDTIIAATVQASETLLQAGATWRDRLPAGPRKTARLFDDEEVAGQGQTTLEEHLDRECGSFCPPGVVCIDYLNGEAQRIFTNRETLLLTPVAEIMAGLWHGLGDALDDVELARQSAAAARKFGDDDQAARMDALAQALRSLASEERPDHRPF